MRSRIAVPMASQNAGFKATVSSRYLLAKRREGRIPPRAQRLTIARGRRESRTARLAQSGRGRAAAIAPKLLSALLDGAAMAGSKVSAPQTMSRENGAG